MKRRGCVMAMIFLATVIFAVGCGTKQDTGKDKEGEEQVKVAENETEKSDETKEAEDGKIAEEHENVSDESKEGTEDTGNSDTEDVTGEEQKDSKTQKSEKNKKHKKDKTDKKDKGKDKDKDKNEKGDKKDEMTEDKDTEEESGEETYSFNCKTEDGEPVAGVRIQICTESACAVIVSDAEGKAVFEAEAGKYEGHILKWPEDYDLISEREFTVKAKTTSYDVVFEICK